MKYDKFISAIELYYGNYDSNEKKEMVLEFIMKRFKESDLSDLFQKIVLSYSSQYKAPPDIAVIADTVSDDIEAQAMSAWNEIKKKSNPYKSLLFADPRVYMAMKSIGGHIAFSLREREEEHWIQKRFIQFFIMYTKNPQNVAKPVMYGLGGHCNYVYIGNDEECKQIEAALPDEALIEKLTKDFKRIPENA